MIVFVLLEIEYILWGHILIREKSNRDYVGQANA